MKRMCTKIVPTILDYVVVGGAFIFFFSLYLYYDLSVTTAAGVNLWNCLFRGEILNFYSGFYPPVQASYLSNGVLGGAYDFFIYVIFALYNFPLWVFEKISGSSFIDPYLGRLYMKSILLFFLVLTAFTIKRIVLHLTNNVYISKWATFIFFFSELIVSTIVVIGGYDIIAVFFTTMGLYYYLKNENKKFLLFFAMAIACKLFALWVLVPLLLIKQKNVIYVMRDLFLSLSIVIIPKLIFAISHFFSPLSNGGNGAIAHANIINNKLFCGNDGPISFGTIPLFFVVTLLIWWLCWKKEKTSQYEIIYLCAISMATFFLFAGTYPYWIILLTPYITLLIALNPHNIKDNVLLEAIFSFGYIFYNACTVRHCFNLNLIVYMLKPGRFPIQGNFDYVDFGISSLMSKISTAIGIDMDHIASLFLTCFAVGLILFLFTNRPQNYKEGIDIESDFRKHAWIRVGLSLCVALIPCIGVIEYYF